MTAELLTSRLTLGEFPSLLLLLVNPSPAVVSSCQETPEGAGGIEVAFSNECYCLLTINFTLGGSAGLSGMAQEEEQVLIGSQSGRETKAKHRLRDNKGVRSCGRTLSNLLSQGRIFCTETVFDRCISSYKCCQYSKLLNLPQKHLSVFKDPYGFS